MLNDLDIPSLEIRRKEARLTTMYNMVNELITSANSIKLLTTGRTEKESKDPNSSKGLYSGHHYNRQTGI